MSFSINRLQGARSRAALCFFCQARAAHLRAVHSSRSAPQEARNFVRSIPTSARTANGRKDEEWVTDRARNGGSVVRRIQKDFWGADFNTTPTTSQPSSAREDSTGSAASWRTPSLAGDQAQNQNTEQKSSAEFRGSMSTYQPLVRRTKAQERAIRCHYCGETGHAYSECPQRSLGGRTTTTSAKSWGSLGTSLTSQLQPGPTSAARQAEDLISASQESDLYVPGERAEELEDTQYARARDESRSRRRERFSYEDARSPATGHRGSAVRDRRNDRRGSRNLLYAREAADIDNDDRAKAERRKQKELKRQRREAAEEAKQVMIPDFISIGHLARLLNVRSQPFERSLRRLGYTDVNHDHIINAENASLIAMEFNFEPVTSQPDEDIDLRAAPQPEDKSALDQRPPVVTIMGHVDHGKTTILDHMRKSSIAANEFGGITQHIGAFQVPMESGRTITFLDTPGHSAFLSMRQRGANVTDIVVLVVAADDGVMPQTIESIKCARSANVPVIVAINKMDKEDAQPDRVKSELARHGVEVEEFGGDTQVVHVSGKTGLGMDTLEEAISTLSEILDHRADTTGVVEGWILEASTQKSGRVATVLVRRGTLRIGDIIVAGKTWARVRTIRNEFGASIDMVSPGMPAEVEGWKDQPAAGDEVLQAPDEQRAASVVDYRLRNAEQLKAAKDIEEVNMARQLEAERRAAELVAAQDASGSLDQANESLLNAQTPKGVQQIYFVVKGDVSGSVEAVINSITGMGNDEVQPSILISGVGPINEGDVERAALAKATIIAFNVTTDGEMRSQAERAGVQLIEQNIIYRLVEAVKALLESHLSPDIITKVTGEADIAQSFSIGIAKRKSLRIAGSKVTNGIIAMGSKVKVLRDGKVIYTGVITSLKNRKQDATEMRKGTECGIAFDGWEDFEAGDRIQCFQEEKRKRTL